MPTRKICSDKAPLNKREWSVSSCYKRGVKSGFVAGIKKGKEQEKKNVRPIIEATAQAIVMSKFKSKPLADASNDLLKSYLQELKVPNYRAMSKEQVMNELRRRGITRVIIPRIL